MLRSDLLCSTFYCKVFVLAKGCLFGYVFSAGNGRYQSVPTWQRTLGKIWWSGNRDDHHQSWKVERFKKKMFFGLALGLNLRLIIRRNTIEFLIRFSEGCVEKVFYCGWNWFVVFSFLSLLTLNVQEDVPRLQGESHGTQPQNQVHPPDGHCTWRWSSLQIRRQQMVSRTTFLENAAGETCLRANRAGGHLCHSRSTTHRWCLMGLAVTPLKQKPT